MKSIKPTIDKDKITPQPIDVFRRHINFMLKKNEEFYTELIKNNNLCNTVKMRRWDSTRKLPLESESVDLIITSPPYVTSYEYADLHQLSLLWFNADKETFRKWPRYDNDPSQFRKKFIGTLHKGTRDSNYLSNIAGQIVNKLAKKKKGLSYSVAKYFSDMKKSFSEMYRVVKPGGKVCIIIGNTMLRGVEILNAQVVAEQMQNIGFKPADLIKREISNKLIAPWRDSITGRFTGLSNPNKKRVYQYEYIIIMSKL